MAPQGFDTPQRLQKIWITQRNLNQRENIVAHWSVAPGFSIDEKTKGRKWTVPLTIWKCIWQWRLNGRVYTYLVRQLYKFFQSTINVWGGGEVSSPNKDYIEQWTHSPNKVSEKGAIQKEKHFFGRLLENVYSLDTTRLALYLSQTSRLTSWCVGK